MATDRYLISLASSCIGSFQGNADIELQSIQPIVPAASVHGLSVQNGAVRPLLCATAWEISVANYIFRCAVTWRAWHGRRRRVDEDGAHEKWSFAKQVTFTAPPL